MINNKLLKSFNKAEQAELSLNIHYNRYGSITERMFDNYIYNSLLDIVQQYEEMNHPMAKELESRRIKESIYWITKIK